MNTTTITFDKKSKKLLVSGQYGKCWRCSPSKWCQNYARRCKTDCWARTALSVALGLKRLGRSSIPKRFRDLHMPKTCSKTSIHCVPDATFKCQSGWGLKLSIQLAFRGLERKECYLHVSHSFTITFFRPAVGNKRTELKSKRNKQITRYCMGQSKMNQ